MEGVWVRVVPPEPGSRAALGTDGDPGRRAANTRVEEQAEGTLGHTTHD